MAEPKLLTWQTVAKWTAGLIVFIVLMATFWGHGYMILTPAVGLAAFRFRLVFEPRWDLDAELKEILNG